MARGNVFQYKLSNCKGTLIALVHKSLRTTVNSSRRRDVDISGRRTSTLHVCSAEDTVTDGWQKLHGSWTAPGCGIICLSNFNGATQAFNSLNDYWRRFWFAETAARCHLFVWLHQLQVHLLTHLTAVSLTVCCCCRDEPVRRCVYGGWADGPKRWGIPPGCHCPRTHLRCQRNRRSTSADMKTNGILSETTVQSPWATFCVADSIHSSHSAQSQVIDGMWCTWRTVCRTDRTRSLLGTAVRRIWWPVTWSSTEPHIHTHVHRDQRQSLMNEIRVDDSDRKQMSTQQLQLLLNLQFGFWLF